MSVAENLLLGYLPQGRIFLDKKRLLEVASRKIQEMNETFDPRIKVKNLPIGQRQIVEIGRALLRDVPIIAFDEPTSSLSEHEVTQLFETIRELKEQGRSIIYVSHRLDEIFNLCDTVTVLRDGKRVETFTDMTELTHGILVQRMVGREIKDIYGYKSRKKGKTILEIKNVLGKGLTKAANFKVAKGEIVGFFGLVGAGRTELLKLIFGAEPINSGEVLIDGENVVIKSPVSAIRNGISFSPEDRKDEGVVGVLSVSENINMSCRRNMLKVKLFLDKKKERKNVDFFIEKLKIKTPTREALLGKLSGGNQQKTILARWLSEEGVDIFIMDEPTRGIDVGSKHEIHKIMYQLAEEGKAVIFASSELPEVMGVSDRVIVMREGAIVASVDRAEATEKKILSMAMPVSN